MRTSGKTKRVRRARPVSGGWLGRRPRMLLLAAFALWLAGDTWRLGFVRAPKSSEQQWDAELAELEALSASASSRGAGGGDADGEDWFEKWQPSERAPPRKGWLRWRWGGGEGGGGGGEGGEGGEGAGRGAGDGDGDDRATSNTSEPLPLDLAGGY